MEETGSSHKPLLHSHTKKLILYALYALLPILLLHFYSNQVSFFSFQQISTSTKDCSKTYLVNQTKCEYSQGEWVKSNLSPLYNGTSCETIKLGQNCMVYGRPDKEYLYWKWKPKNCKLSCFEPKTFLNLIRNKHIAFVGDSLARNQLESLLCLIATASKPNLYYTDGDENKFRKWYVPSHNVNISIYWSPFLVKGIEKNDEKDYNTLFLDTLNEKWGSDLDRIDILVISIGHWYLHRAVYHYGAYAGARASPKHSFATGCHYHENCTEIGFYDVYGKALNTTFGAIMKRKLANENTRIRPINVFFVTFSPAHFEGEWDKFGACSKTQPFKENEKVLDGMDAEMRKIGVKEVEEAKLRANKELGESVTFEALDITKLALLRPDGHPGPYMNPFPFANGISDHVQNDCVHWCLPGPIDTWNEILFDVIKRWDGETRVNT